MFHAKRVFTTYIVIFAMIFGVCTPYVNAANDTFTQSDWSSGTSVNTPNNTSNQIGWSEYNTKDTNLIAATDIQLDVSEQSVHIDFATDSDYVQEDSMNGTIIGGGAVRLNGSGDSTTVTGLLYAPDTTNPTTHIQFESGSLTSNITGTVNVPTGFIKDATSLFAEGSGNGGVLDAGGLTDDHYVNIFALLKSDGTYDIGFSSTDDPDLPAGFVRKAWIGPFYRTTSVRAFTTSMDGDRLKLDFGDNSAGHYIGYTRGDGVWAGTVTSRRTYKNISSVTPLIYVQNVKGYVYDTCQQRPNYTACQTYNKGYIEVNESPQEAIDDVDGAEMRGDLIELTLQYHQWLLLTKGYAYGYINWFTYNRNEHLTNPLYPTTPYYTTTDTNSQISTTTWGAINSIQTTQTAPTNTDITYLVSFDNKNTWKYYNGSSWQDTTLANIDTNGMTKTELEALTVTEWSQIFTQGTIDLAANLSTADSTVTPELDNIQINYTEQQTQVLTSNTFDTEDPVNMIAKLTWAETLNANTDVKLQMRTSPDNSSWTDWCGPDNDVEDTCDTNTYFTDPAGNETIDDVHRDGINDRYIQYKVFLSTVDGQNTPILDNVTLEYTSLTEVTIEEPTTSRVINAVNDGYIGLNEGTITDTNNVETNLEVKFQKNNHRATFPKNTQITQRTNQNFNFQNFTLEEVGVKNQQRDSRVAIRLGVPGEKLNFSQDITMTVYVGHAYNDEIMDILYQEEGESTWNPHATCVVSEGSCTFQTDHATIYTINGQLQSEGDTPININTEVQDTLTLDCFDTASGTGDHTVTLGTVADPGKVTAGTPATGQSTCTVTTNDDQGYYLTIIDDNAAANTVLTHTDPNTAAIYEIADLSQFPATTTWSAPTTKGLGFSVINFPDEDLTNNTLDGTWTETGTCPEGSVADTNTYAGIPDTAETIAAVTQYESLSTTTNICYKVDVPSSQASGQYTGSVTYTATSDASSYLN